MPSHATFQFQDVYLHFLQSFDQTVTGPMLKTVRLRRPYGDLVLAESKQLDPRETAGKREFIKAVFKCAKGYIVMTTFEGHQTGSLHYFS